MSTELSPDVGLLAMIDEVVGGQLRCEIIDVTGHKHHVTGSFPIADVGLDLDEPSALPAFVPCRIVAQDGDHATVEIEDARYAVFASALVSSDEVMVARRV